MITFRKIQLERHGAPDELKVVEDQLPLPGPREVRVQVAAAGVGFSDVMAQHGGYPLAPGLPLTPGYDLVGRVDAVGSEVADIKPGQMIAALNPSLGCYTEYAMLPAKLAVPVPDGLDPAAVVSVVLNYLTAHATLHLKAQIQPGQSVLIHSAAGGVGTALAQLGRLSGLTMYGTASKPKHGILEDCGVIPIDYRNEDFLERIRRETKDGVDAAFDPIGGSHMRRSYRTLKRGGCLVSYAFAPTYEGGLLPMALGAMQWGLLFLLPDGRRVRLCTTPAAVRKDNDWYRRTLTELLNLLADGRIAPVIGARIPLLEASKAHALMESGNATGKVVLVA